jgi:hypothetical protein
MQVTLVHYALRLMGERLKKSNVFEWHKQFREGHGNMEDDERSGQPRSHSIDESVEKVQNLGYSDSQPSLLCGNIEVIM